MAGHNAAQEAGDTNKLSESLEGLLAKREHSENDSLTASKVVDLAMLFASFFPAWACLAVMAFSVDCSDAGTRGSLVGFYLHRVGPPL
jgi:hypothetical protein